MYERELESLGLIERAVAHAALARSAAHASGAALVAHRFTALARTQLEYLLAAAEAGADVLVTLTWVEGRAATAVNDEAVGILSDHGDLRRLEEPMERFGPGELASIERGLFEEGPIRPAEGAVELVETVGVEAEAEAVAAEVNRLLGDGLAGHEIAVVFRDPRRRLHWLEWALDSASIPYDVDVPVSLRATAFGAAVGHLLAFVRGGDRARLGAYLRTPYSGLDLAKADGLDARWRRTRLDEARRLVAQVRDADAAAGGLLASAVSLAGARWCDRTAESWSSILDRMLANAYGRDAPVWEDACIADGDAQRAVVSVLEDLAPIPEIEGVSWLEDALAEATVQPRIVERPGHVQLMDAERVRSRRFRAVLLGGLDSGEFPRSRDEGDPDAVSRLLARVGVEGPRRAELDSERLLFYQAVTRASERLVLLRRTADSEGTPLKPSVFWEEFLDIYREPLEPEEESPAHRFVPPTRRISRPAPRIASGTGSAAEARRRSQATRGPGRGAGPLSDIGAERAEFSASELECYLSCPYKWFVERVVRAERLDAELGPLETGQLAHETLRRFYETWTDAGPRRVALQDLDDALSLLGAVWDETVLGLEPAGAVELEACARTRASVRGLVRQDAECFSGYVPELLEWDFGIEDEPEDLGGFSLRGRVDRIDSSASGLLLMDYKRGAVHAHRKFEELGLVQLPLYAEVARRRLGRGLAGAFYRSLTALENKGFFVQALVNDPGPGAGGGGVDAEGMDGVIASAVERARFAVEGIRAGRIEPDPRNDDACRWCPAATFCEGSAAR
jgi:RecB family exonuclease